MEIRKGKAARKVALTDKSFDDLMEKVKDNAVKNGATVIEYAIPLADERNGVIVEGIPRGSNLYEEYADELTHIKSFGDAIDFFRHLSEREGLSYYKLQKILLEAKTLCKSGKRKNNIIELLTLDDIRRLVGESANHLSYNTYRDIISDTINMDKESFDYKEGRILNPILSACVLGCLYNGIYSSDMSALDNLSSTDINRLEKSITIRPNDAEPYTIQAEEWLIDRLYNLSSDVMQRRKRRSGIVWERTEGKYPNSCFKFTFKSQPDWDNMNKASSVMRYDRLLKPLTKFSFLNVFKSGIYHRIEERLAERCIDIAEVMSMSGRPPLEIEDIFLEEYEKCGVYKRNSPRNAKEFVMI